MAWQAAATRAQEERFDAAQYEFFAAGAAGNTLEVATSTAIEVRTVHRVVSWSRAKRCNFPLGVLPFGFVSPTPPPALPPGQPVTYPPPLGVFRRAR